MKIHVVLEETRTGEKIVGIYENVQDAIRKQNACHSIRRIQEYETVPRRGQLTPTPLSFASPEEMLSYAQDVDLYNPKTGEYVFGYNNAGALCSYNMNEEEVRILLEERMGDKYFSDNEYWGAYLGPGGSIYDDPEDEALDEEDLENLYSNLDYCKAHYMEAGWVTCRDYERAYFGEEDDMDKSDIEMEGL